MELRAFNSSWWCFLTSRVCAQSRHPCPIVIDTFSSVCDLVDLSIHLSKQSKDILLYPFAKEALLPLNSIFKLELAHGLQTLNTLSAVDRFTTIEWLEIYLFSLCINGYFLRKNHWLFNFRLWLCSRKLVKEHGRLCRVPQDAPFDEDVFCALVYIIIDPADVWSHNCLHRLVLCFLKQIRPQPIYHNLKV